MLGVWQYVALLVALVGWFIALFRGSLPRGVHAFLARFVRYQAHVSAYVWLVAEPFPSFRGWPGTYPIDLEIAGPQPQNRWKTGFRIVLAIPAYVFASVLSTVLQIVGAARVDGGDRRRPRSEGDARPRPPTASATRRRPTPTCCS